jgi:hypothetical protein
LDLPPPLLSVAKSHFHVERVNAGVSFETFSCLLPVGKRFFDFEVVLKIEIQLNITVLKWFSKHFPPNDDFVFQILLKKLNY